MFFKITLIFFKELYICLCKLYVIILIYMCIYKYE